MTAPDASRLSSRRRLAFRLAIGFGALALAAGCWACSPVYVVKAGLAEASILRARRPIAEVVADPEVDQETKDKLELVLEARAYASEVLGIDVGDAYTTFTRLESDTLALVLSAAHRDRLQSKTWWFPIVGHVPYKGFFSERDARAEQERLREEGFDTYLRPTAAFSTLGWFNDPMLSTALYADPIEVVETVIHELSHRHLFVSGHVGFNESFATFVGRVGAAELFCSRAREGGLGPDMEACNRAVARWRDYQRFSVFIDAMVDDLEAVYGDPTLGYDDKVSRREAIFDRSLERFDSEVAPTFESVSFGGFRNTPLNNATLLARIRYFHRLPDFEALMEAQGSDLRSVLAHLKERAPTVDDPFELLPRSDSVLAGVSFRGRS